MPNICLLPTQSLWDWIWSSRKFPLSYLDEKPFKILSWKTSLTWPFVSKHQRKPTLLHQPKIPNWSPTSQASCSTSASKGSHHHIGLGRPALQLGNGAPGMASWTNHRLAALSPHFLGKFCHELPHMIYQILPNQRANRITQCSCICPYDLMPSCTWDNPLYIKMVHHVFWCVGMLSEWFPSVDGGWCGQWPLVIFCFCT